MSDSNIILQGVARMLGKRLKKCENYDANVCAFKVSAETGWKPIALSGYPFSEELSYVRMTRRVRLRANPEYLFCGVSGSIDVGVCSINRPNKIQSVSPTYHTTSGDSRWPVFISHPHGQLEDLQSFLDHPDLHRAVKQLLRHESESLHIFQGSIHVYFKPKSPEEVLAAVDALESLVDLFAPQSDKTALTDLPSEFQYLAPLIRRWSVSDDSERGDVLEESTKSDLEGLVSAVGPHLRAIDCYLDSFKDEPTPEAATALSRLAECAIEARLKIESQ